MSLQQTHMQMSIVPFASLSPATAYGKIEFFAFTDLEECLKTLERFSHGFRRRTATADEPPVITDLTAALRADLMWVLELVSCVNRWLSLDVGQGGYGMRHNSPLLSSYLTLSCK